MKRQVILPNNKVVPAIGQGTWQLGERTDRLSKEIDALRVGIESGMTLIDTAEMYGNGKTEDFVGQAIKGLKRNNLFIISKVLPTNAGFRDIFKSCEISLERMGTDYLDMYLLHWRGNVPLEETVNCMEELVRTGKIRQWGVSNFDTDDMKELWLLPNGTHCAVNQVLYHIGSRGIEYDLVPWMEERGIPLMAYCPLAVGGKLKDGLYNNPVLKVIAEKYRATVPQIMLAFVIRDENIIAIPRTSSIEHALDNAEAMEIELSAEDMFLINKEFPPPTRKVRLDVQ